MDAVLDVISEELGIFKEDVSLEDNFFELGGNSANAVSVVVKLRRAGYQKVYHFRNTYNIEDRIYNY